MKKIILAIGMAALMLVSGTNVYLANQRNEMENNLSLENLEAEGNWIYEVLKWGYRIVEGVTVAYGGYEAYDHFFGSKDGAYGEPTRGVFSRIDNGVTFVHDKYFCEKVEGADVCEPGTFYFGPEYRQSN